MKALVWIFLSVLMLGSEILASGPARVLVFSKTAGFRHDSISVGIAMLQSLGSTSQFNVTATEDAAQFNETNLRQFACVIFLCTTGDVLNDAQQLAFGNYIRNGGGYVGIHSASDTEHTWPWYGQLVGAYFVSHPAIQSATIKVSDFAHPSTQGLPKRWARTDEWYSFSKNPRGLVHVLATLDESSYSASNPMGFDHPISWCQFFEGGRSWYTALGHTIESYSEPLFRAHVLGGVLWAAGLKEGDAGASLESNFRKVVLDSVYNPTQFAVAPDGRVFFAERYGIVKIWKPETKTNVVAGTVLVFAFNEDGLMGLALDSNFSTNHWIYLFYSPAEGAEQRVARFEIRGDQLDLASEKILLRIPTQRDSCCHAGGGLEFGPAGNLFIGVGDNTDPFESNGFAPIDERAGRAKFDAQRTASNANDLRGKILRIHPEPDGTYSIPAGNLFVPGTPNTRPEIFVMGNRNPFRFSVDQESGWLYWGEVGPDALNDDPLRGPRGYDEWNQARAAGNFGWPYFVANNKPYRDFDFVGQTNGPAFAPATPINLSPNNTGPQSLPPARGAWIWYPYGDSAEFPEITTGPGRTAMAGPIYRFDTNVVNSRKLPKYFDKTLFIYEWSRGFFKEVKIDDNGNILKINPILSSMSFARPIDMKIGPDGAIYVAEWGTNFGVNNLDSKISRIEYLGTMTLQIASEIHGPFADEPEIYFDDAAKSFSVPLANEHRFFRVRSAQARRIAGAQRIGNNLRITLE